MDSSEQTLASLEDEVVLAYHPLINDDSYNKYLTIKTFNYKEESHKVGLFDEVVRKIVLNGFQKEAISIEQKLEEFKVVGVKI